MGWPQIDWEKIANQQSSELALLTDLLQCWLNRFDPEAKVIDPLVTDTRDAVNAMKRRRY
jgi:hypothetical protein